MKPNIPSLGQGRQNCLMCLLLSGAVLSSDVKLHQGMGRPSISGEQHPPSWRQHDRHGERKLRGPRDYVPGNAGALQMRRVNYDLFMRGRTAVVSSWTSCPFLWSPVNTFLTCFLVLWVVSYNSSHLTSRHIIAVNTPQPSTEETENKTDEKTMGSNFCLVKRKC